MICSLFIVNNFVFKYGNEKLIEEFEELIDNESSMALNQTDYGVEVIYYPQKENKKMYFMESCWKE